MPHLEIGLQLINNSVSDPTEKSMLSRWLKEYSAYKSRSMRRVNILEAITEGYDTAAEIVAHTGISHSSVHRIINELISKKRIRSIKTKNPNNRLEFRYETV
jgi:predicted HTH transcriptional regulator